MCKPIIANQRHLLTVTPFRIVISFNVNHTVDAENEPEIEEDSTGKAELGEMKSKPNFEVDIVRGTKTLTFTCSFLQGAPAEGEYSECTNSMMQSAEIRTSDTFKTMPLFFSFADDVFGIDEFTIFDGAWEDKNYAVAGDVLDGVSAHIRMRSALVLIAGSFAPYNSTCTIC